MKTPVLNSIINSTSHLSPPIFLFHFPSRHHTHLLYIPHPKLRSSTIRFAEASPNIAAAAATTNCRGWDDSQQLSSDWASSGESFELRDFVASVGISDKKYGFTFLLGIVFAFAFSRVKVSYIALVPASAVVFAAGFSFGFVRSGGGIDLFSVGKVKKKGKESSNPRVYVNAAEEFLNEFELNVNELKKSLFRAIDSEEIRMDELERYADVIEAMQTSALNTRNAIQTEIDGVKLDNRKLPSRRSKKISEVGSEFVQFLGGMFAGRKVVSAKPSKVKENDNPKPVDPVSLSRNQAQGIEQDVNKDVSDFKGSSRSFVSSPGASSKFALDWDGERRIRIVSDSTEMDPEVVVEGAKRFSGGEEDYRQNDRRVSWKIDQSDGDDTWRLRDRVQERLDADASVARIQKDTSTRSFEDSNGAYSSQSRERNDHEETFSSRFREDAYSSAISDDVAFNRYLTEANNLLKEAKECIRERQDEEHAEVMLYKSAKLLAKAVALKPMSLLAVGQLGNTYLLHGELKLKISRELRATLSTWGPLSFENQGSMRVERAELRRKDKLVEVLSNVCEECEELLVEAGRNYRSALSIDGNDVRALYNWGLALTFRAQLIADIGPEAAFDADKLFLAATDKFDAMMSKSNVHAPDALFKWGVVLQQRSRLRPPNSREKVKLLQQARRLYEDALHMDSDNVQVREALLSCTSELTRRSFRSF